MDAFAGLSAALRSDQAAIEAWRLDYNTFRPNSAPDDQTPEAFARLSAAARPLAPPCRDQGIHPDGLIEIFQRGHGTRLVVHTRSHVPCRHTTVAAH